eukprot:scaffold103127_cov17-Tisochrysis_lutea.AAC.1
MKSMHAPGRTVSNHKIGAGSSSDLVVEALGDTPESHEAIPSPFTHATTIVHVAAQIYDGAWCMWHRAEHCAENNGMLQIIILQQMLMGRCSTKVHVAEDHAGNKLAVKVQHEGLR